MSAEVYFNCVTLDWWCASGKAKIPARPSRARVSPLRWRQTGAVWGITLMQHPDLPTMSLFHLIAMLIQSIYRGRVVLEHHDLWHLALCGVDHPTITEQI